VAEKGVLGSLTDPAEIVYRQDVLRDSLSQPTIIGQIYAITADAIPGERREYFSLFCGSKDAVLQRSVRVPEILMTQLRMLRTLTQEHAGSFRSEGFTRFFRMLSKDLDDEFFTTVLYHLPELRFRRGILISAALGQGNHGVGYVPGRHRSRTGSSGYRRAARDTAFRYPIVTTTDSRRWVT
jgi:hypothetical protein